jgi:hypothetical protein
VRLHLKNIQTLHLILVRLESLCCEHLSSLIRLYSYGFHVTLKTHRYGNHNLLHGSCFQNFLLIASVLEHVFSTCKLNLIFANMKFLRGVNFLLNYESWVEHRFFNVNYGIISFDRLILFLRGWLDIKWYDFVVTLLWRTTCVLNCGRMITCPQIFLILLKKALFLLCIFLRCISNPAWLDFKTYTFIRVNHEIFLCPSRPLSG